MTEDRMNRNAVNGDARPPEEPRRRVLRWLGLGLLGVFFAECLWLLGAFLRPRDRGDSDGDETSLIVVGPVSEFARDSVTAVPAGRFFLARLDDGGFLALSRECTHLACTVPWVAEKGLFVCPCHASTFDIVGNVISAPATRALDTYAVRIENGIVKVDVTRPRRRETFAASQVVHP